MRGRQERRPTRPLLLEALIRSPPATSPSPPPLPPGRGQPASPAAAHAAAPNPLVPPHNEPQTRKFPASVAAVGRTDLRAWADRWTAWRFAPCCFAANQGVRRVDPAFCRLRRSYAVPADTAQRKL